MSRISPHAVIDPRAVIADDVEVGPFTLIGPHVQLGAGCRVLSHVVLAGHTTIGRNNIFHPHCVIGGDPQDKKYRGGSTRLEIGDGNIFREASTVHTGTEVAGGVTRLGNNNLIMINCHIAHDAQFGNNCILANNVMIAGHVVCGNNVNLAGAVGVHHFVRMGDFCFVSGASRIRKDVPPFVKVDGSDRIRGLNDEGLRRAGFPESDIEALELACRRLFCEKDRPFATVMNEFDTQNGLNPQVKKMIEFLRLRDKGKHGRYLESLRTA
jgi:UDP-N-acetylglucosamine acyltransferase